MVPLKRAPLFIHRRCGQVTNSIHRTLRDTMYNMFYKTKYKLYTTSLNILKCCNTFKTFHIQLGINSIKVRLAAATTRRTAPTAAYTACAGGGTSSHLRHQAALVSLATPHTIQYTNNSVLSNKKIITISISNDLFSKLIFNIDKTQSKVYK